MDDETLFAIEALAAANGGYFTRTDLALRLGIDPRAVTLLLRSGAARRVRHGAYALARTYDRLDAVGQFTVRCCAVADKLGPRAVLCGAASLAVRGRPLVEVDLTYVDVVRLDGNNGRREAGVRHRDFVLEDSDLVEVDGRLVTSEARAIWEAGVKVSPRSSLVLMDDALHRASVTRDELARIGERFAAWEGAQKPRLALALADGRAETPGESVTRWMFHVLRLPMPELQYVVRDAATGRSLGRTDFVWLDYRTLGEFDGKIKYARAFVEDKEPADVVMDEKTRERGMCRQRFGMLRFIWSGVWRPTRAEAVWIRSELEANRRRFL